MNKVISTVMSSGNFKQHKGVDRKSKTIVFSRFQKGVQSVRTIVDTGYNEKGQKVSDPSVKSVFINTAKQWRTIVPAAKTSPIGLSSVISKVESDAGAVPNCKFCGGKKFTSSKGNSVCANACWTKNSNSKKATASKGKKSTKAKLPHRQFATKAPAQPAPKQQKVSYAVHLEPGDLVCVAEYKPDMTTVLNKNFFGTIMSVKKSSYSPEIDQIKVSWHKTDPDADGFRYFRVMSSTDSNNILRRKENVSASVHGFYVISRPNVIVERKV